MDHAHDQVVWVVMVLPELLLESMRLPISVFDFFLKLVRLSGYFSDALAQQNLLLAR